MGNRLDGKVCIITGAGAGMGRASALEMARQGGRVVVTDVKVSAGQETVTAIRNEGGEAVFVECDLQDSDAILALVNETVQQYGGIDVIHNNAAVHPINLTEQTSIDDLPEDVWDVVCNVNLRAVWLTVKHAVPHLKKSKGASVVNVASTGALVAYPMAGVYCATKGGVVMLTKAMAVDLGKYGIRCNCYCPGTINTDMTRTYIEAAADPQKATNDLVGSHLIPRLGEPEEIAKLACFLASDDSSFITGASYLIDGGSLAWRGTNA